MRLSRRYVKLPLLLLPILVAAAPPGIADSPPGAAGEDWPATPAEACDYRCTPGYRETLDYIGTLAARSPHLRLSFFGESSEGYPLPLVTAARGRLFDPARARKSGMPIVLIVNGIHAGEVDGKDASLLLLKEIASGEAAALLDSLVLLIVPIYNVDGHERVRPTNRLEQNGPVEGMGFRTNGRGLDLNRDFLKMESPETISLVGSLFRRWRPHAILDCHVTDGMDFQYEMTYFAGEGLNAPAPLREYVTRLKGAIGRGLERAGHKAAPFWDLNDKSDPNSGVTLWAATPRYSTAYFEAQDRVSLLAEAHAHKPFRVRVGATHALIRSMLEEIAGDPAALVEAVRRSERETAGRAAAAFPFTLESVPSTESETVDYLGLEFTVASSEVTGRKRVLWSDRPITWRVPLYNRRIPRLQVETPRGYLLSRAYGNVAEKIHLHGLRVERTLEDAEIEVEVHRATGISWSERPFQGHHPAVAETRLSREKRSFPAGTWWIPLDQAGASLAVWMLEARSPDGLLHWNYFDNLLERKMVVTNHILEEMAARELEKPGVREAYRQALESDPGMQADPRKRLLWFYDRSPYFDPEVGLYPVFRVMDPFQVPTAAWSPTEAPPSPSRAGGGR